MNNEKPGSLITMMGVPHQLYCAQSGRKYTADGDGLMEVDDRDRGDLNGLGAEELKRQAAPSAPNQFAPMPDNTLVEDHNAEKHQAGDILQK